MTGYRHPNWQGSQVVNSTTTRTVAADNAFTPFGERYAINGITGYFAGMLMQYPYMQDGYQADERLYHDGQGRWVSPDPAGLGAVDLTNPQSLNRYVYVMNDPLDNVDPERVGCEHRNDLLYHQRRRTAGNHLPSDDNMCGLCRVISTPEHGWWASYLRSGGLRGRCCGDGKK